MSNDLNQKNKATAAVHNEVHDSKKNEYNDSNYYYNVLTNQLSILSERGAQTKESILKNFFGIPGIKHIFGKYVVEHSDNVSKLDVVLNNADNYYDNHSIKLLVDGVYFKKGHVLTNDQDSRFGEWSGMAFDKKGDLILISDRGAYLKSSIVTEDGYLQNFVNTTIGTIVVEKSIGTKKDFEELAVYNGSCYISDESLHRIFLYQDCDFEKVPVRVITAFNPNFNFHYLSKELSYNKGIEAFDINSEGKFLAISEYGQDKKNSSVHQAYYWRISCESHYKDTSFCQTIDFDKGFTYLSNEGYGVSGLKFLKNGDLLVLERHYNKIFGGFAENYEIDIKYIKKQEIENAIEKNTEIKGKSIIHIDNDSISGKYGYADNFESIAVKEENDLTLIYILSDDNRAPFERSILLEFEINDYLLSDDKGTTLVKSEMPDPYVDL